MINSNSPDISNRKNTRKKELDPTSLKLEESKANSLNGSQINKENFNEDHEENEEENYEFDENNSSVESQSLCRSLISENDSFTKENKKNMRAIIKSKLGEKSILDIAKDLNSAIEVK